jgi:hypothetical protein
MAGIFVVVKDHFWHKLMKGKLTHTPAVTIILYRSGASTHLGFVVYFGYFELYACFDCHDCHLLVMKCIVASFGSPPNWHVCYCNLAGDV